MKNYMILVKCVFMFLIVLGLWQIPYILSNVYPLTEETHNPMNIVIQLAIIAIFIIAVKLSHIDNKEYGLQWLDDTKRHMATSVILAGVYILITLYFQGLIVGLISLPPISLFQVLIEISKALIAGFTTELVFRGYMQGRLTGAYGFLPALYVSSFLFSIHDLSLLSLPTLNTVFEIMRVFILGIFLGLLLQRTQSLAGPFAFQATRLLAYPLIPTTFIPVPIVMLIFDIIAIITVTLLMYIAIPKAKKRLGVYSPP